MRIQHNTRAKNSYRNNTGNAMKLGKNLEKLSSGYKINRAADDAAGLAISEKMRSQITGLDAASRNVKDGISLVKTAEGALQEIHDMLHRMTYLATQSANGTYDDPVDRNNIQKEANSLQTEIDRIAESANFNGQPLLDGSLQSGHVVSFSHDPLSGNQIALSANFYCETFIPGGPRAVEYQFTVGGDQELNAEPGSFNLYAAIVVIKVKPGATVSAQQIEDALHDAGRRFAGGKSNGVYEATKKVLSSIRVTGEGVTVSGNGTEQVGTQQPPRENKLTLQIGDTGSDYNQLNLNIANMHCEALGIGTVSLGTQAEAKASIEKIRQAIDTVSENRGNLGAIQNRLEHTCCNLGTMQENLQDAESTIRDTDVADEMTAYTKNNVLLRSAQAMLAQANQLPQGVLQLLQ